MTDDRKDLTIVLSDQVKDQIGDDPEMAAVLRELMAVLRQANAGVQNGQYASVDDALEILIGSRPEIIGAVDDDDEILKDEISIVDIYKITE